MIKDIVNEINLIDETISESYVDQLISIAMLYDKQITLIQECENRNIDGYNIFQEEFYQEADQKDSVMDKATGKGKDEHIAFKIVAFLPRLVTAMISSIGKATNEETAQKATTVAKEADKELKASPNKLAIAGGILAAAGIGYGAHALVSSKNKKDLNNKIDSSKKEISEKETDIKEKSEKISKLETEIENLKNQISTKDSEIKTKNDTINKQNTTIKNQNADIETYKTLMQSAQSALLSDDLGSKDTKIAEQEKIIAGMKTHISGLINEKNNLLKINALERKDTREAEEKFERLRNAYNAQTIRKAETDARNRQYEKDINGKMIEIQGLFRQLVSKDQEISGLNDELDEACEIVRTYVKEINELKKKKDVNKDVLREQFRKSKNEINELNNKISGLNNQIAAYARKDTNNETVKQIKEKLQSILSLSETYKKTVFNDKESPEKQLQKFMDVTFNIPADQASKESTSGVLKEIVERIDEYEKGDHSSAEIDRTIKDVFSKLKTINNIQEVEIVITALDKSMKKTLKGGVKGIKQVDQDKITADIQKIVATTNSLIDKYNAAISAVQTNLSDVKNSNKILAKINKENNERGIFAFDLDKQLVYSKINFKHLETSITNTLNNIRSIIKNAGVKVSNPVSNKVIEFNGKLKSERSLNDANFVAVYSYKDDGLVEIEQCLKSTQKNLKDIVPEIEKFVNSFKNNEKISKEDKDNTLKSIDKAHKEVKLYLQILDPVCTMYAADSKAFLQTMKNAKFFKDHQ